MNEVPAAPVVASASKKGVRPLPLTAVCLVAWFACFWTLRVSFQFETVAFGEKHGAPWFPYFAGLVALGGIVCFVGVWRMRRAGVLAFIGLTGAQNLVMLLGMHAWTPGMVLGPSVLTFVSLAYVDRMH